MSARTGPEAVFQAQVLEIASLYRWSTYHTYDSRRSAAGFPDLVLLRAPELIFAELKGEKGSTSRDQDEWLASLHQVAEAVTAANDVCHSEGIGPWPAPAVEVYLWRPSDFDAIVKRLSAPVAVAA